MKRTLVFAAFTFISTLAFSQAAVEVGLKGGLNMSSLSSDDKTVDLSNKTGYHAGFYGLIKIANIGIQPEVLYSIRGSEFELSSIASSAYDQEFTYLDIPVILKLYTVAGINIQAGPQFGIMLDASGEDSAGQKIKSGDFESTDISGAFGLGWDAPFGLQVNARYVLGFSDLSPAGESKNRMFQLSVGYKLFGLGR